MRPAFARRRRLIAVAFVALLALVIGALTSAEAAPAVKSVAITPPPVSVTSCAGGPVRTATAHPGDCLLIKARGFTPRAHVAARFLSTPTKSSAVWADASGTVTYRFTVATTRLRAVDVLTLVEAIPATPTRAEAPGPVGDVVVAVAPFAVWRFRVEVRQPSR
jgi:hypothetical protein